MVAYNGNAMPNDKTIFSGKIFSVKDFGVWLGIEPFNSVQDLYDEALKPISSEFVCMALGVPPTARAVD